MRYNWGDFKGNPDKLMERFFDAHSVRGELDDSHI